MQVIEPADRLDRSALLGAFRRRDDSAVRALYRAYGRLVFAVAYRALGRRDLAEEATQQTFVKAWQAADRVDVDRDPSPWLATIAKHAAIDIYRRESRRPTVSFASVPANDQALVSEPPDLASLEIVWQVRRAIDALPPDEAAVVRLQHLEGLTQAELADRLGIPLGTVKSRSHRAHGRLATLLDHLRVRADAPPSPPPSRSPEALRGIVPRTAGARGRTSGERPTSRRLDSRTRNRT